MCNKHVSTERASLRCGFVTFKQGPVVQAPRGSYDVDASICAIMRKSRAISTSVSAATALRKNS